MVDMRPNYPPPPYPPPSPSFGRPFGSGPPPPPPRPPAPRQLLLALGALVGAVVLVAATLVIILVVRDDPGPGPGPQPSPSPSSSATLDEQAVAGAEAIARGAEEFAGSYGYGPGVDDATPYGAVAQFVDPWPTNPFTGEPMLPGAEPGDYTFYTATSMGDGQEYLGYVEVLLSTGEVYSAPFEY